MYSSSRWVWIKGYDAEFSLPCSDSEIEAQGRDCEQTRHNWN